MAKVMCQFWTGFKNIGNCYFSKDGTSSQFVFCVNKYTCKFSSLIRVLNGQNYQNIPNFFLSSVKILIGVVF